MKKHGILHRELAALVASLGHGDIIIIADSGLPVPPGVPCIDLAVTQGVPGFFDVIKAVLTEMQVERAVIADELKSNQCFLENACSIVAPVSLETVSHQELKEISVNARAIIRTGEWTPYANIVLYAGVAF